MLRGNTANNHLFSYDWKSTRRHIPLQGKAKSVKWCVNLYCKRRHDVHRRLWRTVLYSWSLVIYYRAKRLPHRLVQSRHTWRTNRDDEKIVTIATLLKEQGYATGQFGKNHLGDLNHMLPTNHGFDEFFGNLYHLNAEEEPEMYDYPSKKEFPEFFEKFGPRGVLHSWATDGMMRQKCQGGER